MSTDEEQIAKANLLDDYAATKKRTTLLRSEIDRQRELLKELGTYLHGIVNRQDYYKTSSPRWTELAEIKKLQALCEEFAAEDEKLTALANRLAALGVTTRL